MVTVTEKRPQFFGTLGDADTLAYQIPTEPVAANFYEVLIGECELAVRVADAHEVST